MIHTFELNKLLNEIQIIKVLIEHYEMNEIQELLVRLKEKKAVIEVPMSISGLTLVYIAYVCNGYFRIHLRVEPQSLIHGGRTIKVFDCSISSVGRLKTALDEVIESLSSTLPKSAKWFVSRIDFTANLTSEYVKECVVLAKRGKDPYRYKDSINMPGSSYRKSKSVILNYYNKFDHISKEVNNDSFDAHLLKEAKNIFRIEVQCLNHNKLRHIRNTFHLPRKCSLYDYLRPDIAAWTVLSYYEKVIGKADYYSLAKAAKIVENAEFGPRKKENIKRWLQLIAQARSMSKARQQFVEGKVLGRTQIVVKGSLNTFRNYERYCRDIGVNPVTIPKDWGISYIPNPIKTIDVGKVVGIQ